MGNGSEDDPLSGINVCQCKYRRAVRVCILGFATLVAAGVLFCGSTGKIAGRVTDSKSKEPVAGVNVFVIGTTLGAVTDLSGEYSILNVPPDTFDLKASILGYDPVTVKGIRISIDLTTRQDFELSETVLEQKEVVITAERPLIQKDLTATTAVIGKDQIATLPVTEVTQLLNLQAGFVSGSLRGGRKGEVAYWIDGVPVTDAYNGSQVVEVNKNQIQELQLISGAFNAEYGQAMSGIVNIATKEGERKYSGSLGVYGGQYVTSADTRTDTSGQVSSQLFPGLSSFRPTAIRNIEGSLSGPLAGDNVTFFTNGRYIYFDGWEMGLRRFTPQNIAYTDSLQKFHLYRDSSGRGDSSVVPMNWSERRYAQGKVTWRITPLVKLSTNYIYDHTDSKPYDRAYFLNPDGKGTDHNNSNTVIFQFSHTLSSSTFYTVGASFFDLDFQHYLYENPFDERYVHPDVIAGNVPNSDKSYLTGGTDLNRFHRSTITKLLKADLSSQIDQSHLLKGGVELRLHKISYENITLRPVSAQSSFDPARSDPFISTEIEPLSSQYHDVYEHRPIEWSGYIQDKIELKNFIVNVGLRLDYFYPDGVVLNDESDPDIYFPGKPSNIFFDYNRNGLRDPNEPLKTVEDRRGYWYRMATAKTQLSPRFGASFPITAEGVVHFSYGHFFQIPRFERLYENPDFKLTGTGDNHGIIGNADLKPEQTINGEIGIQQQLSEDLGVDLTAYIRDIRNLTGSGVNDEISLFTGGTYSKYVNRDFGFVKGIVLTVNKKFSRGFSSTVDYTYQVARGSASDPQEIQKALAQGKSPALQISPLGWDQRHTLNATVSYAASPLTVSFIGQYGSGTPYTPLNSIDPNALLTNSQLKPSFFNLDARASYEFDLPPLRCIAFVRAFNLFDIRNETNVYDNSGRATFTPYEERDLASGVQRQLVNTIDQWYHDPTYYSEPRRIELGMNLEF